MYVVTSLLENVFQQRYSQWLVTIHHIPKLIITTVMIWSVYYAISGYVTLVQRATVGRIGHLPPDKFPGLGFDGDSGWGRYRDKRPGQTRLAAAVKKAAPVPLVDTQGKNGKYVGSAWPTFQRSDWNAGRVFVGGKHFVIKARTLIMINICSWKENISTA